MPKVQSTPDLLSPGKWMFPYPIYTVCTRYLEEVEGQVILVGGGGGKTKSGVPNAFDLLQFTKYGDISSIEVVHHEDTKDEIIYSAAVHPSLPVIAVSQGNSCFIYQITFSSKKISGLQLLQSFQSDFKDNDSVQNLCEFSPNGELLATGGEDGNIRLWDFDHKMDSKHKIQAEARILHEIVFDTTMNSMSFSTDSNMIVYTSKTTCSMWEIENKKELQTVKPLPKPVGSSFRGCAFVGESGDKFITLQGKPRFRSLLTEWNTINGSLVRSYRPSFGGPQTAVATSVNKKRQLLAVAFGEGDVEVFVVTPGGKITSGFRKKDVHSFITTAIAITNDQQFAISGSVDRTLAVTPLTIKSGSLLCSLLFFILLIMLLAVCTFICVYGVLPAMSVIPSI